MTTPPEAPSTDDRARVVAACRALIGSRFPDGTDRGAAALLAADGSILTGTSPDFANAAVAVCHETEPLCAAHRLDVPIVASVCLHRKADGHFVVLSPCGVCCERLAVHGPRVLVAVPDERDAAVVRWVTLREVVPHYWLTAFPDEVPEWTQST